MQAHHSLSILRVATAVLLALVFIATICSLLGSASVDAALPGEAPTSPTGTIDFIGPGEGNGLTLASAKLFMNRSCGGEELYTSPTYVIARSTSNPASATQLFRNNNTCGRTATGVGHVLSINVAADNTYAYWLTRNGNIVRSRHNTASVTNPEVLRRMVETNPNSSPPVYSIAVNATTIFWSEGRRIYSTPKSIGGAYTLLGSTTYGARKLYVTNTTPQRLLYLDGSNLMSMNLTSPYSQNTRASNVGDYYVDGEWIYLGRNLGSTYQLSSISVSSFSPRTPPHYTSPVDPSLRVSHIAAGGGRLYWFERQGSFGGQIFMMTIPSGTRSAQTDSLRNIVTMVADSSHLYWLNQITPGDGIYRLTPGSAVASVTGDMRITGITATQGIQVGDNQIPLIGWKPTVVRVFVASTPGNQGAWQNVRARLDVEGSSVSHYAVMSQLPAASNPRVLTSTFNFALSDVETLETLGVPRHITATLFSMSGRREDNRTNNTLSKHLQFFDHRELRLPVFRYSNLHKGVDCHTDHADGYITPWNNIISHTVDARDLLPIHLMSIYPATGMGTPPIEDSDCGAYIRAVDQMKVWIDHTYTGGGHTGLVMQPDSGHPGGTCWSWGTIGNKVINIQDFYRDHALAHEEGHSFPGVYSSGHTWDASSHYPRRPRPPSDPAEWMGNFIGLQMYGGTRLILGSLHPNIPSHDVYDLMSYGSPNWSSPYTYCKLLKYTSGNTICCPDPVEGGCSSPDLPSQNTDSLLTPIIDSTESQAAGIQNDPDRPEADTPYLYVSGWISPTNEVSFNPFEIVNSAKDISTLCSGSTYTISLLDSGDNTLQNCTFDYMSVHIDNFDNPGPTPAPYLFSAYLPWDSNTLNITLEYKSNVLTKRTVSAHAPLNVVQAFSPPEPVTGIHTLSWIASDEDGDPLVFSIWYSPDNGGTWLPIDVLNTSPDQTIDIDFDQLPGSNDGEGLLRVLASDGVLTTESRNETPFTVKHKYPSISLTPMYDADGNITLVQANATDPEDNVITNPSQIVWSSNWDGQLGGGLIFNTARLSPGEHILTAYVMDSDEMSSSASIVVNVPSNFESGGLVAYPGKLGHLFFDASLPMTLTVPKDAVNEMGRFRASLPLDTSFDPPGAIGPSFIISAALSTGEPIKNFYAPLTLTIAYTHDVIPVYNESRAKIYTWDEDKLKWTGLNTTVDKIHNYAKTTVLHLSRFVLVVPDEPMLYLPIISQ